MTGATQGLWLATIFEHSCRTHKVTLFSVIMVFLALGTPSARAQPAAYLLFSPDVRAEGAARSLVALNRGAEATWGNPGALAFLHGAAVAGTRTPDTGIFIDAATFTFGSAGYGFSVGGRNLFLDANYSRYSYLDVFYDGSSPSFERTFGGVAALELSDGIGVGVGVKSYEYQFDGPPPACSCDSSFPVFDVGALWVFPTKVVIPAEGSVGASITNMGRDVSNWGGDTPLPRTFRAAAGLKFRSRSAGESGYWSPDTRAPVVTLSPAIAYERHIATGPGFYGPVSHQDVEMISAGGEIRAVDFLTFRAGYIHDSTGDNSGATWGAGISLRNLVGLDYAQYPRGLDLGHGYKLGAWLRVAGRS